MESSPGRAVLLEPQPWNLPEGKFRTGQCRPYRAPINAPNTRHRVPGPHLIVPLEAARLNRCCSVFIPFAHLVAQCRPISQMWLHQSEPCASRLCHKTCHPEPLFWAKDLPKYFGLNCLFAALSPCTPSSRPKSPDAALKTNVSREIPSQAQGQHRASR